MVTVHASSVLALNFTAISTMQSDYIVGIEVGEHSITLPPEIFNNALKSVSAGQPCEYYKSATIVYIYFVPILLSPVTIISYVIQNISSVFENSTCNTWYETDMLICAIL